MLANLGFARIFTKAGLLNETDCQFSAISGASGAVWFMTQLSYSQPFLDAVLLDNDPEGTAMYNFAFDWMTSYSEMLETQPNTLFCRLISPFGFCSFLYSTTLPHFAIYWQILNRNLPRTLN